jgi:hypothetical protein
MNDEKSIYVGYDPREAAAFAVARSSCRRYLTQPIPIKGLVLDKLIKQKLYTRKFVNKPTEFGTYTMWDLISNAPQSTQHANSRFLVPELARTGWAMFCDGDVMFRDNVQNMFKGLDEKYAVYCVKHNFSPADKKKMDGKIQTAYSRKNWSSVMIFNCDHPSNKKLTVEMINTVPGRDLHRFCWLKDEEIGALDQKWNWLVGHSDQAILPSIVHFTDGVPDMPGFEHVDYAEEWREELARWAA